MPTYDTPNSSGTYDPPDGLAEFKLVVVGSEGAGGSETSAGAAGKVEGVLPLSGGESFTLYVAGTVSDGPDGYPTVGAPSPIADGGDSNSTSEVNEWGGAGGAVTVLERDGDGVYVAIAEGGGGGAGTYNPTYNGDHGGGGGARGGIGGQGAQDGGGSGEGGDGGTQENLDADPDIPATAGHPGGTTAIAELTSVTETTESPATPRIEIIDHPRNVSLTVADHTDTTVDLAVDADNSESWTIHRSTSSGFSPDSGNQVASISSGGAQTYTDTGLTQGKIYYYKAVATNPAGSTATSEVSQTTNGPAPTFGSLTVVDDSGDGHADAFDCDFTRGGSDEDHLEIRGSIDNGSSFSQLGTDQTPDTTQYTTPEQDDGQEYVLKVTAVYPDTESDSGTLTRTTDPRDLSQDDITPVDTSVEDQLRIPNPGVADYGDYRGQLRVTNSGDAYGSDVVVAYDGADLVFTGLPDGEKFDLQGRHETEHVNGVWAGVSAITLLPQPGDVQVASIQATQATITWDDTADNEDDILIERRREYADGFGAYEEVVVKAANATQHVDDTIVPGVTYQWRVSNRTEHVVSRATTAQATSNSIRPSNAAPTSGWWAEVDTPSADTPRTPPIVGSPQRDPSVNDLEQVTIPVPKDEGWDSDAFIDAPVRVWHDGKRLPIDQLADRGQTPGATTLIAEGGTALYETDEYQFTNTDVHAAVNAVVDDTPYGKDVTAPSVSEDEVITVDTQDAAETYLDRRRSDAPVVVRADGTVERGQTCWVWEGEQYTSGGTVVSGEFGDDADYSAAEAADAVGGTIQRTITLDHDIPGDEVEIRIRDKYANLEGELQVRIDGKTVGADLVTNTQNKTLGWTNYTGGQSYENDTSGESVSPSALSAGDHIVEVEAVNAIPGGTSVSTTGTWAVDVVSVHDGRYPPGGFDNTTDSNDALAQPGYHSPDPVGAVFLVRGFRSGVGARLASIWDDTSGVQAVAVSQNYGDTWIERSNSTGVNASWADPSVDLLVRLAIGPYGTQSATPTTGVSSQSVSEYTLYKDVRDSPPLINDQFRGTRESILTSLVERGDMLWALDWDRDADQQVVQMANIGDRTSDRELDLVNYNWNTRTLGRQKESATVKGAAITVSEESVTADLINDNSLANDNLVEGTAQVRDAATGDAYERGIDWRLNEASGTLSYPAATAISDGQALLVDYEWKPIGSYAVPNASPKKALDDVTVSATTDAMCEALAFYLVDRLEDPVESGTLTIPELPPGWSVLEALAVDGLPNDGAWTPRGLSVQDGRVELEVASRRRVQDVVADLRGRLEQHGERI